MKLKSKKVVRKPAKNSRQANIASYEFSYYVKVLVVALFFVLGVATIASGVFLTRNSTYNQGSAGAVPNSINVYAFGSTNTAVSPKLSLKIRRPGASSDVVYETKRVDARNNYSEYVFNVPNGVYKGDLVYLEYNNDTSDTDTAFGTCNGGRDLFVQKVRIGDKVIQLDTRVTGSENIDPTLDTQARADAASKRVIYDRANNECGGQYVVGRDKMDFATYRDFDRVGGRRELGVMYYGDNLWPGGSFFRGQMHWDGALRINIDWTTGDGPVPTITPTPTPTQGSTPTPIGTPSNGTKIIDISQVRWDVTYYQSNHERTSTLRGVTADKVNYVNTQTTGIQVRGWPHGARKYDFSIRWVANLDLDGKYRLITKVNDGIRIWVNGVQVLNDWKGRAGAVDLVSSEVNAKGMSLVEVEYMQKLEDAYLDLRVINTNVQPFGPTPTPIGITPTPIPTATPTSGSTPTPVPTGGIVCPTTSNFLYGLANQSLVPREMSQAEFTDPNSWNADKNPFVIRGFDIHPRSSYRNKYVFYGGPTDLGALQLNTMFRDKRLPEIVGNYKMYEWNWANNTRGGPMAALGLMDVPVTGLKANYNEEILAPWRGNNQPNFITLIYADKSRITIKYGADDNLAGGYGVHFNNICTDPNLLRIYRDARKSNKPLIQLRFYDHLGWARSDSNEVMVAVRDTGMFLDPRSIKDWWMQHQNQSSRIVSSSEDQRYR